MAYFRCTSILDVGLDTTDTNAIGYTTGSPIVGQTDGAVYKQVHSDPWAHEIYGDYRSGQIALRGKNAGYWQPWRIVLDSLNYTTYCTPSNIGAAAANHTHAYAPLDGAGTSGTWPISISGSAASAKLIKDAGDGHDIELAYSKAGISTTSWLAAWNGYELRAISKDTVRTVIGAAAVNHTHSYAGSATAGGAANSVKGSLTLNVNGTSTVYDGSANKTVTISTFGKATSSAAGTVGLVPAPKAAQNTSFLRGDGTWAEPVGTTYTTFTGATADASGKSGLVPGPGKGTSNYILRADGHWHPMPEASDTEQGVVRVLTGNSQYGLSMSGGNIVNTGVIEVSAGRENGTLYVRHGGPGGVTSEVTVPGLKSAAYTESTAYASASHTHSYAGSATAGGAANSVKGSLTLQLNGVTKATYNGSSAATVDISTEAIGLYPLYPRISTSTGAGKVNTKLYYLMVSLLMPNAASNTFKICYKDAFGNYKEHRFLYYHSGMSSYNETELNNVYAFVSSDGIYTFGGSTPAFFKEPGHHNITYSDNVSILLNQYDGNASGVKLTIAPGGAQIGFVEFYEDPSYSFCLTENTYITMYDLSKKKISDICIGDEILSVDGYGRYIKSIITRIDDGIDEKYDQWIFSDGSIIETCHDHCIYNVDTKKLKYVSMWNIGDHGYGEDGSIIELVEHHEVSKSIHHYNLICDNISNYFANGILTGDRKASCIEYHI